MAGRWRTALAFGLIGAMVVALVVVLLNDGGEVAAEPTTTSTAPPTSTSSPTTTSTSTTTSTTLDPDARKAEVEQILEDLEIAWYDAVYRKDESVLADIVATRLFYDAAIDAMDVAEFANAPSKETVDVIVYEVLLDREDCLVVHFRLDTSAILAGAEPTDGVQILWPTDEGAYRLVTRWASPADLWSDDCDLLNRDEVP